MQRSKSKTKELIVQSAMSCFAELGIEHTTFQAIADKANISQPLVVYHLKTRENIFLTVFQYILDTSLIETELALFNAKSASERLQAYIDVSLKYFRSHPAIPTIYLSFYYLSSFHPQYRMMNDTLKGEATQRILNILAMGLGGGEFKIAHPALTAKLIHTSITGLLLNLATEKSSFRDEDLLNELKTTCLAMAGTYLAK